MDPGDQVRPVRLRDAEQVADHADRQWHGHQVHEVTAGRGRQLVEELVGTLRDAGAKRVHVPEREGGADHAAQPRVLGRIGKDHGLLQALHDRPDLFPAHIPGLDPLLALAERAVPQRRDAVSVPAEHHHVAVAGDQRGRFLAQLPVKGIGLTGRVPHEVEDEQFAFGISASYRA